MKSLVMKAWSIFYSTQLPIPWKFFTDQCSAISSRHSNNFMYRITLKQVKDLITEINAIPWIEFISVMRFLPFCHLEDSEPNHRKHKEAWEGIYDSNEGLECRRWPSAIRWRHNGRDSVSNHQPHHCLLNHLSRRRSKETSKLRVTGLCARNSPGPVNSPHK